MSTKKPASFKDTVLNLRYFPKPFGWIFHVVLLGLAWGDWWAFAGILVIPWVFRAFGWFQWKLDYDMASTWLYRPVGQPELDLIAESNFSEFPPRLDWQPIFYPCTNKEYAAEIARKWNTKDEKNGNIGYVVAFRVYNKFLDRYDVHQVGGSQHTEYWIPAEDLEEMNKNIDGMIQVIDTWKPEQAEEAVFLPNDKYKFVKDNDGWHVYGEKIGGVRKEVQSVWDLGLNSEELETFQDVMMSASFRAEDPEQERKIVDLFNKLLPPRF